MITLQPGGTRVLPVGRKADALFFLHTFRAGEAAEAWQEDYERQVERNRQEPRRYRIPDERPELFRYVVHYEDGTAASVPVRWLAEVFDWLRTGTVSDLPGARIAWIREFESSDKAVLYSMQWNNPYPGKTVTHVDIVAGPAEEDWGMPVVFAVTAGELVE
jgi:hypothetical protein